MACIDGALCLVELPVKLALILFLHERCRMDAQISVIARTI